jgi:ribosome-associated protein
MAKIDFLGLAIKAAAIAEDKKAIATVILDIRTVTTIANYFVITTALSTPQINAISLGIEKIFKGQGIKSLRKDGEFSPLWRVIDYGGIIIHVMSQGIRETYKLEKLWKNAKIIEPKILKIKSEKQIVDIKKKSIRTKNKKIKKIEELIEDKIEKK